MPIAGRPTIAQLRRRLDESETREDRRVRLFAGFTKPRAMVVRGLTDQVLGFAVGEWERLSGAKVLDFGCGVKPYSKIFEFAGAELVGADVVKSKDADVCIDDSTHLPFEDNRFDVVVSFQVLEHIPIAEEYLKEACRLLKPGGKLFLTTNGNWPYHPTPEDYRRWTRSGLVHEISHAGFTVESTGWVLNDYSAALQTFFVLGMYRNRWGRLSGLIRIVQNACIWILEHIMRAEPGFPSVICITGVKK
jgi:SAM-dependent methyltransferase